MAGLVTVDHCFVAKTREEEEETERCYKRYKEMISILPKEKGWLTDESLVHYKGFWLQPDYGFEGLLWMEEHFSAKPNDVLLTTYPKSGTTWLKAVIFSILNRTLYDFSTHPLLTHNSHDCVPTLEIHVFARIPIGDPEILPSPRILASHLPYTLLPKTITDSSCKVVHICRDPRDVFVSSWHFVNKIRASRHHLQPLPLEETFDLFCGGASPYGPCWDHVLGYWKASLEWPDNVLFLKYEDLRKDALLHVKRLAEFLGHPFSAEEEENGVIQEIIKLCSFESMSNLEVNKKGSNRSNLEFNILFREGKVGGWKNCLTSEMIHRIDQITKHKLSGSGLIFQD